MPDRIFAGLCQPAAPPSIIPQNTVSASPSVTRRVMEEWWKNRNASGVHIGGRLYRAKVDGKIYRFQCQIPSDTDKSAQFGFGIRSLAEDRDNQSIILVFQCSETRAELEKAGRFRAEFRYRQYGYYEWSRWGEGTDRGSVEARITSGSTGRHVITVNDWQGQLEVALP